MEKLFDLGNVVITPSLNDFLDRMEVMNLLQRHSTGDYGDSPKEDVQMNVEAIRTGEDRVFSSYTIKNQKIFVITEWDRSYTTLMFANEY